MKLIFIDTLTFNKFSEMQDVNDSTVVLLNTNKSKTISVSNFKFLLETDSIINFLDITKSTDRLCIGFAIGNYFTKNFGTDFCPDEIVFYSKDAVYIEIAEMLEELFKIDITVYGIESNLTLEDVFSIENEQQVNDELKDALKKWKEGRLSAKDVSTRFTKQQIHNKLVTLYGATGSVHYRKHFQKLK